MNKLVALSILLLSTQLVFAQLNKPVAAKLDSIYSDDQKYRMQFDSMMNKFGLQSKELHSLIVLMNQQDSINVVKVTTLLDKYGWLGADSIGTKGNYTLFLVIQHGNQAIQEKYLPMLQAAVKKGNAKGSELALLEDRVLLGQGKMQLYGSQISMDNQTQQYYVSPLADPENVDKRRAAVGLEPLAAYVKDWQIKWDVAQYKKDLPKYIELEKLIIK